MTITLQNRSGRQFVFHLEHAAACTEERCHCGRRLVGVQDYDRASGRKTLRAHKRRVPDAVTINAARTEGDKVSGLPGGVVNIPDVAKAIRAGTLAWGTDKEGTTPHHQAGKAAHAKAAAARAEAAGKRQQEDEGRRAKLVAEAEAKAKSVNDTTQKKAE